MSIEQGVRERRMGDAVRLQYDPELAKEIVAQLVEELELSSEDLYPGKGFTAFTDLFQLSGATLRNHSVRGRDFGGRAVDCDRK